MDESRITRYATEKYVDKINIKDSEIDEVFDELSMRPRKIYKINYVYDKGMCHIQPTPPIMYGNDEVSLNVQHSPQYILQSLTVMQGKTDITNNVANADKTQITLKSISDDINIKIVFKENTSS